MFSALPEELLTNVLQHLDHLSLLACRLTCPKINHVIQSSTELQYRIELGMDGLMDCAAPSTPYPDRLATVIRRRHAWAAMEWNDTASVHLPGTCLAYELVADVLAKLTDLRKFVYAELPSISKTADADQANTNGITTWDLPFAARDFAMDPTQDLVIFLEDTRIPIESMKSRDTHLYVYSMSTRKPHQLAQSPRLVISSPESEPSIHPSVGLPLIMFALLQIANDIVLMQFTTLSGSVHVRLWNWQTGDLWLAQDYPFPCMGCGLLSARAFMLTPIRECGSIEIYALEFSEDCDSRIPNTILKATLLLPSLNPGVSLRSFTTHSSPIIARPPQYKMAIPTAGSHIHVMSVTYDAEFGVKYCLYVPNRALVSYAASTPRRAPIPWKSWGPENTRFMKQGDNSTWLRFVHGTRVVGPTLSRISSLEAPTLISQTMLQLYDFNPYCRRLHSSIQPVNGGETQLLPETRVRNDPLFAETVTTRLPYRRTLYKFDKRYTSFFIDDERLLALAHTLIGESDLDDIDIYTF
ncbi:F-box domain-containing protein [Pleurotus pulmonarius]